MPGSSSLTRTPGASSRAASELVESSGMLASTSGLDIPRMPEVCKRPRLHDHPHGSPEQLLRGPLNRSAPSRQPRPVTPFPGRIAIEPISANERNPLAANHTQFLTTATARASGRTDGSNTGRTPRVPTRPRPAVTRAIPSPVDSSNQRADPRPHSQQRDKVRAATAGPRANEG